MGAMFSFPLILILLFILACISFFFSASEMAVIGLSKLRLRHMIAKGIRHARNIQQLVMKLDKFIAAILIGNDFVNIAISSLVAAVFVHIFGYRWGVVIATFTSSFFVLIFCEITPKILAAKHTEKIALFTAPIMEIFIKILHPIIRIFTGASSLILRIFKLGTPKRSPLITEEELRLMIEIGKEEGVLTDEERKMLHRIFEFGDTKVGEVMVPVDKIVAINLNSTLEQLLNTFAEEGHARLPVYKDSINNIVGIVYARDLLYMNRDRELFLLADLLHKADYVFPALRVNELLRKFQAEKIQIAIVADDKQKTLGLVTLEDLFEEIVGEIEEEHVRYPLNKN